MKEQTGSEAPKATFSPKGGFDRLESMFEFQKNFSEKFIPFKSLTEADQDHWLEKMSTCLMMEAAELKEETNWKHHKSAKKKLDMEKIKYEIMDQLAFVICSACVAGMNVEELYQCFMTKVQVNYDRKKAGY